MRHFYLLLVICLLATSCDPYQKLLKSTDFNLKLNKAKEFYNNEEYEKATALFEEVLATLRGTKNFEQVYYYYCYANYGNENYLSAAYHFKYIADNYPLFEKAAECEYISAYCYYLLSPNDNLDQTDTYKAIEAMQLFINNHPEDPKSEKANGIIDLLRAKLETKATKAANLYLDIENYKAAITSFKGILKDFPDTKNAEVIYFKLIKASFEYAQKSIQTKKAERFNQTIEYYLNFIDKFASSKYSKEAQGIYTSSLKELENLKNIKNN
jgi:outer membrane protein assembly factor BamD